MDVMTPPPPLRGVYVRLYTNPIEKGNVFNIL